MNNLPQFNLLMRLTPLATMGISAVYSWKLVDDATAQAQIVFQEHVNICFSTLIKQSIL